MLGLLQSGLLQSEMPPKAYTENGLDDTYGSEIGGGKSVHDRMGVRFCKYSHDFDDFNSNDLFSGNLTSEDTKEHINTILSDINRVLTGKKRMTRDWFRRVNNLDNILYNGGSGEGFLNYIENALHNGSISKEYAQMSIHYLKDMMDISMKDNQSFRRAFGIPKTKTNAYNGQPRHISDWEQKVNDNYNRIEHLVKVIDASEAVGVADVLKDNVESSNNEFEATMHMFRTGTDDNKIVDDNPTGPLMTDNGINKPTDKQVPVKVGPVNPELGQNETAYRYQGPLNLSCSGGYCPNMKPGIFSRVWQYLTDKRYRTTKVPVFDHDPAGYTGGYLIHVPKREARGIHRKIRERKIAQANPGPQKDQLPLLHIIRSEAV